LIEVINRSALDLTMGEIEHGHLACYARAIHDGDSRLVNQNGYLFYSFDGRHYLVGYVGTDTVLILPDRYEGSQYHIYDWAVYNCGAITDVFIPDSVLSIGDYAFYKCSSLSRIALPPTLTRIGRYTFRGCESLSTITLPACVDEIGEYAFLGCTSLRSIVLPASLSRIDMYAFYRCSSLTDLQYLGSTDAWNAMPKGSHWCDFVPATSVRCEQESVPLR
jgi:hypothetical protein